MFYACIRRFDVTGTVEIFLGTKQGLNNDARSKWHNVHAWNPILRFTNHNVEPNLFAVAVAQHVPLSEKYEHHTF